MAVTEVVPALRKQPGTRPTPLEGDDMTEATCSIEGCEKPHKGRGWCSMHYARWRTHGDPLKALISFQHGDTCKVPGCDKPYRGRGYCSAHHTNLLRYGYPVVHKPTPIERFWSAVRRAPNGCWEWVGNRDPFGYGTFKVDGKPHRAHRWGYQFLIGPVPDDLQMDHLCRNTSCVNPIHLEPVTAKVNTLRGFSQSAKNARKTHCHRGHPFDEVNTMEVPGGRACRTCMNDGQRRRRAAKKQETR